MIFPQAEHFAVGPARVVMAMRAIHAVLKPLKDLVRPDMAEREKITLRWRSSFVFSAQCSLGFPDVLQTVSVIGSYFAPCKISHFEGELKRHLLRSGARSFSDA